ncbi:unnamed protein product [Diamesa tonsa]
MLKNLILVPRFNLRRFSLSSFNLHSDIKIYSCTEKKKVPLVLKNPVYSSWYTCGPTVYDSAHIGHASTYVRLDIVQRILRDYFKVNLVTAMNVTNIDDKIIKRSKEMNKDWQVIAEEYEIEFWEDLRNLNVKLPDIRVRVTDRMDEIIKFISEIESKGQAYPAIDGSVYFKTDSYKNYGKLQNIVLDSGDHNVKSSIADFALWKAAKADEPSWDTKWGKGRPGWHIECSTIASSIFGHHLDFHAGGIDLKFPHHENEEAQSCVFHGVEDWVENWIHTGHLHLKGQSEKMSKSLKNTVSIRELLAAHSADQFRVACLLSHYRSSIEFGPELLTAADAVLKKFNSFVNDSNAFICGLKQNVVIDEEIVIEKFKSCKLEVKESLQDDFNTTRAIGSMIDLISAVSKMLNNTHGSSNGFQTGSDKALVQGVVNYVQDMLKTFGVGGSEQPDPIEDTNYENLVNSVINMRNELRLQARDTKNKDLFKVCDSIRNSMKQNQIEIKDHGNLSSWNKIK